METRTQTGLDDRDGAAVVLDGRAVLVHVAQRGGHVVVGLGQQAAVGRQVPELQSKALLEVFQRLGVVTWGREREDSFLKTSSYLSLEWN